LDTKTVLNLPAKRFPAHQKFSDWLHKHKIDLSVQDRTALLNLGPDMKAMRVILIQTDRSNYRMVWKDVKLQIEKVV
jgi:hypothetical protein